MWARRSEGSQFYPSHDSPLSASVPTRVFNRCTLFRIVSLAVPQFANFQMANVKRVLHKSSPQQQETSKSIKINRSKLKIKASDKREWDQATCSVCMEAPHNAVLLLCSSHDKGCRPYMCATGRRYSNCLDQYTKAYMKVTEIEGTSQGGTNSGLQSHQRLRSSPSEMEAMELLCPLCRGQVKGWTVVEPARKYLNSKKRTCMQDKCTFSGNYRALRRHVKTEHPCSRPRAVDPALEEKWKRLEQQRERSDVISTIISTTPGAVVLGDYVIERNHTNPFFLDYGWDNYLNNDDDIARLELLSRGNYEDLGLHRSRSSRVPFASSRSYRRLLLDNRLRRRRNLG